MIQRLDKGWGKGRYIYILTEVPNININKTAAGKLDGWDEGRTHQRYMTGGHRSTNLRRLLIYGPATGRRG